MNKQITIDGVTKIEKGEKAGELIFTTTDGQFLLRGEPAPELIEANKVAELELVASRYRDTQRNEYTQVTATCKCGRGGWIRLPNRPTTRW
jgi:hypothetical protein